MQLQEIEGNLRADSLSPIVFIVGTGPSLRAVPEDFLWTISRSYTTIGLNQAWRHLEPQFSITIHPELVTDEAKTVWVVKGFKPRDMFGNPVPSFTYDDKRHYVFRTVKKLREEFSPNTLYQGGGVQTTAMHFAHLLGAAHIIMLGTDMCSLTGEHHGHEQHVRWCGKQPDDQYREYREYTAKMREWLRKRGTTVMTLSPFVGVGHAEEDFQRLKDELQLKDLPKPVDVSGRNR